ncbi:MAG: hypothetical protein C6Y22_03285 [Hapalosiphonaceae cyanobacterium JJU2]|nr:MAG: hypothetical protein C6Y22_03285 [Hapalosiphonaceae cyanobacterium JJU2]
MNKHILINTKTIIACTLVLGFTNSLLCLSPVQAQQSQKKPTLVEKIKRFFFGTRPGGVATNRNQGGAVRGNCPNLGQSKAQPIIALVPASEQGIPYVEQTITERPTFWFYVPYLPVAQVNAEFVLLDNEGQEVYSQIFPLNKQKLGIIGLQLPSTISPLKQNNKYRWAFSAICNPQNRAADAIVNGRLERISVSPTLNNQLKTASAQERISIYTDQRLWYETLTNLAELQRRNPQDAEIKSAWANVLQLMGLPKDAPQNWNIYTLSNK